MAFGGYPPPEHLLGDLGMEAELTTAETAWVRTRATPFVAAADGGVRIGVLATLVDIVGGAIERVCSSPIGWPPPTSRCSGSDRSSDPRWRPAGPWCGVAGRPW